MEYMFQNANGNDANICKQVYQIVNARQIKALMFHDQMADMFDFLGLMGFKRMHEYQYFVESAEHRSLMRYYINHHNELLPEAQIEVISIVPQDWVKYSRSDVTQQVRAQYVEKLFDDYCEWENDTKQLLESCAKKLFDAGKISDFNKINCLIKDVDCELKSADRMKIILSAVDYNPVYVASIQEDIHEEFRQKTKNIGIEIN